jgi:Asp-tRNA(Asn)/Glu-tRNA(Gln) amidotransferase A subunit family amidase
VQLVGRSVSGLAEWLAASRDERERMLQSCLEVIRELDPAIHAWVQVQPEMPPGDGPLSGIPFGVKDIIETRGLATEYGSPIYRGRIGVDDAAVVRELRQRGGVMVGKTQTTAFAYRTPAPTRNPHNLEHTPGGSSSGSAAAVAAGMVPLALGTQTQGSVLRPASFCGIAGFKPTYGHMPMEGVLPFAKSLDTLGFFTATAVDMLALWHALGYEGGSAALGTSKGGGTRPTLGVRQETSVGRVRPTFVDPRSADPPNVPLGLPDPIPDVEAEMASAFRSAIARLRTAGISIHPVSLGEMLTKLNEASRVIMAYEAARFHERRFNEHGSKLADLADLIREGLKIDTRDYEEGRRFVSECRDRVAEIYRTTPVILVPSATGPAPFSLASTGDPRMNGPWTALGTPAISIPMGASNGLPLGLQLTADRGDDARLLRTAVQVEGVLKA